MMAAAAAAGGGSVVSAALSALKAACRQMASSTSAGEDEAADRLMLAMQVWRDARDELSELAAFDCSLAALCDASGGLPSDIWRGGVLPFLTNADALRLSGACRCMLPVAAVGLRCLTVRFREGAATEQLAGQMRAQLIQQLFFGGAK